MELLNKNIEVALKNLDTSEDNKKILKSILYKEHINRELLAKHTYENFFK